MDLSHDINAQMFLNMCVHIYVCTSCICKYQNREKLTQKEVWVPRKKRMSNEETRMRHYTHEDLILVFQ